MDILVKAIESIREIGLTNNDLTRYGDGFEKAIELCLFSLKELNKQAKTEQLNIAGVISSALPCPFCGGKDLQFISDVDGDRDVEFIVCMNSDCLCDGRIGKNKEEALSRWNTRHCL